MRLVHTAKPATGAFLISEFREEETPKYAILSHTWETDEVTLRDMQGPCAPSKKGYDKIRNCCAVARRAGYDYVWVDTCCIDKTSSAELSEAINSMYRWYQQADICYAYLADVPARKRQLALPQNCKWFTRGWTLQELIAPPEVVFFNQDWEEIGSRSDLSLQTEISNITHIPLSILSGQDDVETASVAQRMSWASERNTSRLEDQAYCLLGIFDINMPLLYGEGSKAFIRLQEEIIKISDDHSIFAWTCKDQSHGGLLATSPAAFKESANVVLKQGYSTGNSPWTINNKGIQVELPFIGAGRQGLGVAILQCIVRGEKDRLIGIYLRDISLTMDSFERVCCDQFRLIDLIQFRPSQYPSRQIRVKQPRIQGRSQMPRAADKQRLEASLSPIAELKSASNLKEHDGKTPLSHAAQSGDVDMVWLLLTQSDVKIHSKDEMGQTPLSHAAEEGHEMVCRMILARGDAQSHLMDSNGRTPLSYASAAGHVDVVKVFLARGEMEPDTTDNDGWTPLAHAIKHGHTEVVRLLLDRGAEITRGDVSGRPLLAYAVQGGHAEITALLINHGADINTKDRNGEALLSLAVKWKHIKVASVLLDLGAGIDVKDGAGLTVLNHAVQMRSQKFALFLLDRGANPKLPDRELCTPLFQAVRDKNVEMAKLLLERGANANLPNRECCTPLIQTVRDKNFEMAKLLLECGADANLWDKEFCTPLIHTVRNKNVEMAKLLLERGADVNLRDNTYRRALDYAISEKHQHAVELLLDYGANVNAAKMSGLTPLVAAINQGHEGIVTLLLDKDADIHTKLTQNMRTPLSFAAAKGHESSVHRLCAMGANTDAQDTMGWTPLMWAAHEGHEKAVAVLLQFGANTEAQSSVGMTALSYAKESRHIEVMNLLMHTESPTPANQTWDKSKKALRQPLMDLKKHFRHT